MSETNKKYTYFASDFHLGAPNDAESLQREKEIVAWLTSIESSANCIYLVGDIFDFWFEYKHVIPKGFSRLQGKIAALTDNGIPVHFFYGNHDMWMFEYFKKELGVEIHSDDIQVSIGTKKLFIATEMVSEKEIRVINSSRKYFDHLFVNGFLQDCIQILDFQ